MNAVGHLTGEAVIRRYAALLHRDIPRPPRRAPNVAASPFERARQSGSGCDILHPTT
jgi:hypothetical protein